MVDGKDNLATDDTPESESVLQEIGMGARKNRTVKTKEERERFRTELQSRSVLLFVTLASIGDAVITTDETGAVNFLNPMAAQLTGWTLEEAVGMDIDSVFRVIDGATGETIPNPVRVALTNVSKASLPPDAMLVRKDGSRIPIDDSGAPILGMAEEILGAVLVFRDVTERKRSERLLKYRSELDRMAARISTTFIASPVSEVDTGIDSALREIGEFLRADRSYVFLYGRDGTTLRCTHEWSANGVEKISRTPGMIPIPPSWAKRLQNREHMYIPSTDAIPEDAVVERAFWTQRGIKTLVAVPMVQEDRVLGFVGVDSIREAKRWPEETIDLLYLIGNVFAGAMERRDAQRKLDAAREREVQIGSRIQQALLLGEPPPPTPDFQVAALTIPSKGVDGDFYDFVLHPNNSLDVIFGDVMGKGVPAALLSAGAKTEFLRSLSHLLATSPRGAIPQPQDIVNTVHSVITPQLMDLDSFVTLSYARFDPKVRKVTLVDCGNTRLIRCCAENGSIEYLAGVNVPLGFSTSEVYSQAEYNYTSGDVFVLYSDGATEARNQAGEMFGIDSLRNLIQEKRHLSPYRMVEAIEEAITNFVGSATLNDDFTCVVIKVVPELTAQAPVAEDQLVVKSNLNELATIRSFVRGFCATHNIRSSDERELNLLALAVNEVASNIMRHAYHGRDDQPVWVRIDCAGNALRVRLSHHGDPFRSPNQIPPPSFDGSREGGFGLYIISRAVDSIAYGLDDEGRQYIELTKQLHSLGGQE